MSDSERNLSDAIKSFDKVVKSTQTLCDKVVEKQKQQQLQLDQQQVQLRTLQAQIQNIIDWIEGVVVPAIGSATIQAIEQFRPWNLKSITLKRLLSQICDKTAWSLFKLTTLTNPIVSLIKPWPVLRVS